MSRLSHRAHWLYWLYRPWPTCDVRCFCPRFSFCNYHILWLRWGAHLVLLQSPWFFSLTLLCWLLFFILPLKFSCAPDLLLYLTQSPLSTPTALHKIIPKAILTFHTFCLTPNPTATGHPTDISSSTFSDWRALESTQRHKHQTHGHFHCFIS